MGRMKLTGNEWILLKQVFEIVLEKDAEKREKENKSWYIAEHNGSYEDIRPKVEELYEYFKGIPQRSRAQKISKFAKRNPGISDFLEKKLEGKIPPEMSMKITEDNYIPLEWTLCFFVTYLGFKKEEAQETIENVLDRLLLHKRRSHGGKMGYISSLGGDVSDIENLFPDTRDPEYHYDPEKPSFIDLDKVGKSEQELKRKIPPRLSNQQKFILTKLFKEGGKSKKRSLSRALAYEFNTSGNSHSASFSRALSRLEKRGLLTVSVHYSPNFVKLTNKGKRAGKEFVKRVDDGRFNLEFENL